MGDGRPDGGRDEHREHRVVGGTGGGGCGDREKLADGSISPGRGSAALAEVRLEIERHHAMPAAVRRIVRRRRTGRRVQDRVAVRWVPRIVGDSDWWNNVEPTLWRR